MSSYKGPDSSLGYRSITPACLHWIQCSYSGFTLQMLRAEAISVGLLSWIRNPHINKDLQDWAHNYLLHCLYIPSFSMSGSHWYKRGPSMYIQDQNLVLILFAERKALRKTLCRRFDTLRGIWMIRLVFEIYLWIEDESWSRHQKNSTEMKQNWYQAKKWRGSHFTLTQVQDFVISFKRPSRGGEKWASKSSA